ncbi:MAG TPA: hypothetical protein DEV72_22865, partial [Ktedonobacter sp.]|nr:hypothetical protein [Ktedonobacter sp.]
VVKVAVTWRVTVTLFVAPAGGVVTAAPSQDASKTKQKISTTLHQPGIQTSSRIVALAACLLAAPHDLLILVRLLNIEYPSA